MSKTDATFIDEKGDLTIRTQNIKGKRVSASDKLSDTALIKTDNGETELVRKTTQNIEIEDIPNLADTLKNLSATDAALQKQITENEQSITTEASERQNADNTLSTAISNEAAARQAADTQLQNNIDTTRAAIDAEKTRATDAENLLDSAMVKKAIIPNVIADVDVLQQTSLVALLRTLQNTDTGSKTETQIPLPVASSNQHGIMSKEAYAQMQSNTDRIEMLEGAAQRYPVHLGTGELTQAEYQTAFEVAAGVPTGTVPDSGTSLVNLDNNHVITYFTNANAANEHWIDRGIDTVAVATNVIAGIVKGTSNTAGKIFVELDGTMSVYGWDALVSQVSNIVQELGNKQDALTAGTGIIIENNTISATVDNALQNTATGDRSLAVIGSVKSGEADATAIGNAYAGSYDALAIGSYARAYNPHSIAIGSSFAGANARADGAIQIDSGSNNNPYTLQVRDYTLLDTSTGKIPNERLSDDIVSAVQAVSGKVDKAQGTANAGKILGIGDDGNVVPIDGASGAGRNIGDIFWTTRTDSALNGAVEANGAQYNFADVNGGDNNVQELLDSGALPSVSIAEFDAKVASDGGCDCFGYDAGGTFYGWNTSMYGGDYYTKSETPQAGDNLFQKENNVMEKVGQVYGFSETYGVQIDGDGHYAGRETTLDETIIAADYFKVPKKTSRILVRCQKPTADNNYTWYNLYADGWCEQGGRGSSAASTAITFAIPMATSYYALSFGGNGGSSNRNCFLLAGYNRTSTGFTLQAVVVNANSQTSGTGTDSSTWICAGYANASEYTKDKWDYQNVHVERPMVQLFNSATDEAVATCTSVLQDVANLNAGDYVIYWDSADSTDHSHAKPGVSTPLNHGWYRYYKSGWVEQGGSASGIQKPTSATNTSGNTVVEFPVPMANNLYLPTVICTNWDSIHGAVTEPTTTSMRVCGGSYNLPGGIVNLSWSIRGQAA